MNSQKCRNFQVIAGVLFVLTAFSPLILSQDRFQVELYGGISFLRLGDLNLLSRAEEQYNQLLYIERHLGWQGYFINDFPRIANPVPLGFRVKYRMSRKFAVSVEAEGFSQTGETSISGSFTYAPSWSMTEAKDYAPFRLSLQGMSVMGGLHYCFLAGESTELEFGLAGGWCRAEFDFRSSWIYSINLNAEGFSHFSEDGGTLEEDGQGDGFAVKGMLRLNRSLGKRFGLFVETSATYCRLKSISGNGREARLGIPGETTWEGTWGIKREDIEVAWGSDTIFVPTNYWGGWTADQRERDFILDLSGLRLVAGIFFRI